MISIFGKEDPVVPFEGGRIVLDKRDWGTVKSAAETIAFWKQVNEAELVTAQKTGPVTREVYYSEITRKKLLYIAIDNGGHTIPNRHFRIPVKKLGPMSGDVDAPAEIWEFFKSLN